MSNHILKFQLGNLQQDVDKALERMKSDQILNRIWKLDHTIWKPEPDEITNRLGWLWIARLMYPQLNRIQSFVDSVLSEGFQAVVLLGMGGSSLAPEIFRKIFGVKTGYLDLTVLDTTDPRTVESKVKALNLEKTLFVVSTKSGGTVETLSLFKFFFSLTRQQLGSQEVGTHFVAITDPGSKLESTANELNFREVFLNDPHIGGRYSALSFFGLVPAALVGVDIQKILQRAVEMIDQDLLGGTLGTILGIAANQGKDKATFIISKPFHSFGDWVEQLIAESTGKEGKGILPVVSEPLGSPHVYGDDRLFITITRSGTQDEKQVNAITALMDAGHPVVQIQLNDSYDLGGQFFLWELATAVACYHLQINPFNQPNVESAKVLARKMMAEYRETAKIPPAESYKPERRILREFLDKGMPGDYIALQAYLQPTAETISVLQELRLQLRDHYKLATTLGFGPRFLHSTGQLHKGDAGNGLFIQFTYDPKMDIPIPDIAGESESSFTFGTLFKAQALGDGQALMNENRRFIRFQLRADHIRQDIERLLFL